MYVYIYIHIYVYIHVYIHVYIYIYIYTHECAAVIIMLLHCCLGSEGRPQDLLHDDGRGSLAEAPVYYAAL